ncbi:LysR family transcriptional regulator [Hyphococcus sp.]|uniref:LysR family transcriptional regulator n=1 Tax=Hyphococcus sp. TaxID=2038636 RepID=UPI003CCB83CF
MIAAKLKHIIAVDHAGSITAAARALGVTQSTVSRSLADVEAEIGYGLFDRRARDVVATDRGRDFINRAARIISDLDQLSEDARLGREAGETLVRVGVSPASMQGLVNKAAVTLMQRHSELRIHLEAFSAGSGVRALRRGDIDALISPRAPVTGDGSFVFEQLGDLNTRLFARKRHPLAGKAVLKRSEIVKYPVIAPDQMSWHTDQLRTLFGATGGDAARRMHVVEYFPLVADIVAETDSIGVIGDEYAQSTAFMRRFTLLEIDFFAPLAVGYAVRKRWLPTPAVRTFLAALKEFPPGV